MLCASNCRDEFYRAGYSRIGKYPVKITSTIYETEGTFELSGRFEFTAGTVKARANLSPYTMPPLAPIPMLLIQSPIILFNRRFINTSPWLAKAPEIDSSQGKHRDRKPRFRKTKSGSA